MNGLKVELLYTIVGHNLTFFVNGVKISSISLGDMHEDPV